MGTPLVSVVTCVRNGEAYLQEALDSIANQNVPDLESIIIDDGSTDGTVAIAAAHRLKPTIISQGPLGLGLAQNNGMRSARGTYLSFLDCDDVWPAGSLATMMAPLERDPSIDAVHGPVVNTDAKLRPIGPPVAAKLFGAMLMRRERALAVGEIRIDLAHAAGLDWVSRTSAAGWRFHCVTEVVLLRRIHGNNLGIHGREQARDDLMQVIRDHIKRRRP
ncbi:glycosyltransferase family A protein [Rhodoplanes sp. Z2-YC6860]|uniref:glycosyltransferase family A protein n=1 Tax=Rhodoplanes sp. Z2-YC6860 TaxID=674703 RepID=UPI00078E46FC|nr:glycosyltransferase family A protein [Rhodoplanes sp. Z2-YC6860]AMN39828.1 glycosyl transferase [Rhodoplanes sp. Z2-YC6860]